MLKMLLTKKIAETRNRLLLLSILHDVDITTKSSIDLDWTVSKYKDVESFSHDATGNNSGVITFLEDGKYEISYSISLYACKYEQKITIEPKINGSVNAQAKSITYTKGDNEADIVQGNFVLTNISATDELRIYFKAKVKKGAYVSINASETSLTIKRLHN